jgi:hypothetical protein
MASAAAAVIATAKRYLTADEKRNPRAFLDCIRERLAPSRVPTVAAPLRPKRENARRMTTTLPRAAKSRSFRAENPLFATFLRQPFLTFGCRIYVGSRLQVAGTASATIE